MSYADKKYNVEIGPWNKSFSFLHCNYFNGFGELAQSEARKCERFTNKNCRLMFVFSSSMQQKIWSNQGVITWYYESHYWQDNDEIFLCSSSRLIIYKLVAWKNHGRLPTSRSSFLIPALKTALHYSSLFFAPRKSSLLNSPRLENTRKQDSPAHRTN